jgi:hypothetical protein
MAHKMLVPLDFSKLEAYNFRFQNLSASPSSPALGQAYLDTDDNIVYAWNGTAWTSLGAMSAAAILAALLTVDGSGSGLDADLLDAQSSAYFLARANHTGTQVMATISDAGSLATKSTIVSADITDGTIVNVDIAAGAAIALSKLATDPLARANHTGTQLATTISDFDTQVRTSRLDQMAVPTADVSINSHKLTNVTDPSSAQDAATKAYVDAAAAGIDWKASVRVATTAAGTLASSFENGDAIDGITLATGNRILIKDQASGAENGIYVVAASGAPTRATDADSSAEVTGGLAVFVEEGTVNADTGWLITNNGAITVGTTALVFAQFTSLGQITAGAALTKTGSTLDVAVDGSTIEISSDALRVKDAGITDAKLASTFTKKYSTLIGDGAATSIAVTHSLGTRDVLVEIYDAATYETVFVDVVRTSTSVVTVTFAVAPASNAYRAVVIG